MTSSPDLPATRATLDTFRQGSVVVVAEVDGPPELARRLHAMGVWPGTEITVVRRAPFGDPVLYRLQGYRLALRREESACVMVTARRQP